MPLIPFPDVPKLPGVPALARSGTSQFVQPSVSAITPSDSKLPQNLLGIKCAIVNNDGSTTLTPDSFIDFEFREEHKVPNYPVEQGSFSSYNKIALPFECRITITCSGNGPMKKPDFLSAIEILLNGLNLTTIVTPDASYSSLNLTHVDYRRDARQGTTLIIADLNFEEIKIAQQSSKKTTQPQGNKNITFGQLSPTISSQQDLLIL